MSVESLLSTHWRLLPLLFITCYLIRSSHGGDCEPGWFGNNCQWEAACLGDPDERVDCGHPGITEDQCLTNTDCCWDNTIPKKFQCFHKEGCKPGWFGPKCQWDATCLAIRPDEREDCGHPGITKDECLADSDCCWDDRIRKKIQCFHRKAVSDVYQNIMETNDYGCDNAIWNNLIDDCAFKGVTEEMCRALKCCWRSSPRGVIWCYKPNYNAV